MKHTSNGNFGATRSVSAGYEPDLSGPGRINPFALDMSVDGDGGTIRGKPVFTKEQVAFQLNRGDGLITVDGETYRSGANWDGAQGYANNDYYTLANSKGHVAGTPLTTLAFGFYETKATLPEPYIITGPDGKQTVGFAVAAGFSAFDADQRAATRDAIQSWDDLVTVKFVEKPFGEADINLMNTTTGPIQASAYLPYDYGDQYTEISGDVFVNPNQASNHQFDEGQYGLTTLIHELGHTLGLEHPGDYNFGPGFDVNYVNGAEYYQDSNQYSIMSYWGANETGAAHINWENLNFIYASTPVVHDILAIQRIYGADMTTRTGDTTYGFNSNAGRDSYDFTKTPLPVIGIWDAGGNDTLDFSGWNTNSLIDLNDGEFSSGGGRYVPLEEQKARGNLPASYTEAQYAAFLARYNSPDGLLHDNISIAYGAVIENAIGGGGDDLLIANEVANRLDGRGGEDTASWQRSEVGVSVDLSNGRTGGGAAGDKLFSIENLTGSAFADSLTGSRGDNVINGGGGRDTLDGGFGDDTLSYAGLGRGVTVELGSGNSMGSTGGGAAGDRIRGFENLTGTSFDDTLTGNSQDNVITGGAGNDKLNGAAGSDTLLGGAGADMLNGGTGSDVLNGGAGADRLTGGTGKDVFVFDATDTARDVITDFTRGQDKIDLSDLDAITGGGSDRFTFIGSDAFSAAGQVRVFNDGGALTVAADVNGDKIADLLITIQGTSTLTQTDFIFG